MTISTRVREESGFGLVELLIAMTVMVVGITAIVAGLSSGIVAVKRAADESTAAALADAQMEAYRALPNCAIYLDDLHDRVDRLAYIADPAYTAIRRSASRPTRRFSTPGFVRDGQYADEADNRPPVAHRRRRALLLGRHVHRQGTAVTGTLVKKVTLSSATRKTPPTPRRSSASHREFAPPTGCNEPRRRGQPTGC